MSLDQWIQVNITPTKFKCGIANASLEHGKFYDGSTENEISSNVVNKIVIDDGKSATISASGNQGALFGTEGHFDLIDITHNTLIGTYHFYCPYSGSNRIWVDNINNNYVVGYSNCKTGGAIGKVTLDPYSKLQDSIKK